MYQHHLECLLSLVMGVTSAARHNQQPKLRQEAAGEDEIQKRAEQERDRDGGRPQRGGLRDGGQCFLFPFWQIQPLTWAHKSWNTSLSCQDGVVLPAQIPMVSWLPTCHSYLLHLTETSQENGATWEEEEEEEEENNRKDSKRDENNRLWPSEQCIRYSNWTVKSHQRCMDDIRVQNKNTD